MPQKLKVLTSSGKEKVIYWDREEDPTQEEADSAPDYIESKPGVASRAVGGFFEPVVKLYEGVRDTGKSAADKIRKGDYPGAFHDIAAPILTPFEKITAAASGNLPDSPGTELAEQAGIPLSMMKEAYAGGDYARLGGQGLSSLAMLALAARGLKDRGPTKAKLAAEKPTIDMSGMPKLKEHGPYPLRDSPVPLGPPEIAVPFEGLTKSKETPALDMQSRKYQPELDLQFDPTTQQLNLPYKTNEGHSGLSYDRRPPNPLGPRQPELFDVVAANEKFVTKAITPSVLEPTTLRFNRPTWSNFAQQRNLPLEYDVLAKAETSPIPEIAQAVKQVAETQAAKPPTITGTTFSRAEGYKNPYKDSGLKTVAEDFFKSSYARLVQDSPAGKAIAGMIDKYRAEVGHTSGSISAKLKDAVSPLNPEQYKEFQRLLDTGEDLNVSFRGTVENLDVKGSPVGYKGKAKNPLTPEIPEGQVTNADILTNLQDPKNPGFDPSKITLPAQFATSTGQRIQTNTPPRVTDPMIQNALDVARNIDKEFTVRATASGIHLKTPEGELIPFTGKDNYWPRIYSPEMFKDKPALIARLIKQGMAPEAAYKAVNNMRRFGERLIDPQNARVMDLPDHRKDLGALLKHYDDMAHRVAAAEVFGVKDIADPSTPISQLVSQSRDPNKVTKILTQYLDRESGVAPHEADFVKNISKFTTAFYLSKFALSNTNQLGFVPVVTNFKSTGKALADFVKSPKKTWREAEATGALQTVMQEAMRDVGGDSLVSKVYLIKASEGSNRTISAIAGKYYVNDLFNKVKKNPDNARARKSLEDLTLESWDTLSNQDILNEQQIAYGATRVVEKTQGRAQSIDLPYNWDRSPYMNLILLYKKYAFVQGKLLKDAIKQNPTRNVPLLLGLFNLFGEATGDAKAAISGGVSQAMGSDDSPMQAIGERGSKLPFDNKVVNRVLQNYIDSMFLGLAGEAINAARSGKSAMSSTALGPVVGGAIEQVGNIQADIKNQPKSVKKSQFLRGVASHAPFIGSGISRSMRR